MIAQFATLLTSDQVEQVHEASLEILENVGLLVRNEKARTLLVHHGCLLDSASHIVKFPRQVVEHFRAAYPPTFTFHGRDPQFDRTIPDDGPLAMTASSAPNILDPVTGHERRGRSDDMARIAHLFNELPALDLFSVSILCDDAPEGHFSLSRYYPALKNTVKPVRGNVPDVEEAQKIIRLGELIAGSEGAFRERPFITFHYCAVVSPLTLGSDATELLIYLTENGLPGYSSVVPNAGLTSPLTLVGTLAQGNAEFLGWATLQQMVRSGAEIIYSAFPTVGDMRTGSYAPGGIETGIMGMAFAQMARYYNVPSAGYVGLTNAKVADAQAGFEKGMSPSIGVLAGLDLVNVAGLIDALMTFDFSMMVIDDEIMSMIKRIKRGLEFSADNLALDLIAEAGPAGMFLDKQHTVDRMKSCAVLPQVANRDMRETWLENGAVDAQGRAMQRVRDILTRDNPAVFSPEVDARIRAEFSGLVAGDSVPPQGWKRPSIPTSKKKKRRKRKFSRQSGE